MDPPKNFTRYNTDFCHAPLVYATDDNGKLYVRVWDPALDPVLSDEDTVRALKDKPFYAEITEDPDPHHCVFWGDSDMLRDEILGHLVDRTMTDDLGRTPIFRYLHWVLGNIKFWKIACYPYHGGPYAEISDLTESRFFGVSFEDTREILYEVFHEDSGNYLGEEDEAPDYVPESLAKYYFEGTIFEKIPDYVLGKDSPAIDDVAPLLRS